MEHWKGYNPAMVQGGDVFELPLFPLHTVLFPRMHLPLRIFEPRYRQMLQYCLDHEKVFGVLLIRSGSEVGAPAEPYRVGTVANIEGVQPQPDGTMAVAARGTRRFRLLELTQQTPYLVGLVEYLDDRGPPPPDSVIEETREVASRCLQKTLALTGEWARRARLPGDPERLSYHLCARLPRGRRTKQRLLETLATSERLTALLPLLRQEEQALKRQVEDRAWLTSANLN